MCNFHLQYMGALSPYTYWIEHTDIDFIKSFSDPIKTLRSTGRKYVMSLICV